MYSRVFRTYDVLHVDGIFDFEIRILQLETDAQSICFHVLHAFFFHLDAVQFGQSRYVFYTNENRHRDYYYFYDSISPIDIVTRERIFYDFA